MKLNPDCIRDILLFVESESSFLGVIRLDTKNIPDDSPISKYDRGVLLYHIRQCASSNLITKVTYADLGDYVYVSDLTPSGHEFLAATRAEKNWAKTKTIAGKVGDFSFKALSAIAEGVTGAAIKSYFEKNP